MNKDIHTLAWEVRAYRPGDEVQLADLFSQVFGKEVSSGWWLWKLKERPSPSENVLLAVTQEGGKERIVGQYAGIPIRVKLGDSVHDAMVSVDTMTSPDFRRRGILTKLGAIAYESWADAGVAAVLGLPNERWGSRTSALGWVKLFPLPWLRLPMRLDVMLAGSRRVPRMLKTAARGVGALVSRVIARRWQRHGMERQGIEIDEANVEMLSAFDTIWSKVSSHYEHSIVRDGEWVRWRYLEVEGFRYTVLLARANGEPEGYIAYRVDASRGRPTGYIADLFAAPDAVAIPRVLLGRALGDLWARRVGSVMATALPGSSLDRLLKATGFKPMPAAFSTEMVPLDPSLDLAHLSEQGSWHLTAGDFDVV